VIRESVSTHVAAVPGPTGRKTRSFSERERRVGRARPREQGRCAVPDPTDTTDLTIEEVLARFEASGYTSQLAARPEGRVVCFACHTTSDAAEVHIEQLCRTEGTSDPADMLAIAALRCPECGARGTVVLGYGPDASLDDVEVLRLLEDDRTR
jgi:hypothetical protein